MDKIRDRIAKRYQMNSCKGSLLFWTNLKIGDFPKISSIIPKLHKNQVQHRKVSAPKKQKEVAAPKSQWEAKKMV